MKKLATIAGAAALLAATLVPAFAASNCSNGTTGPGSSNTCTVNNSSNVTVNNVNDAQIVNTVRSTSITGNNSASNNTLGGSIVTGNATLNASVGSVANINTTNVTAGLGGGNNSGENLITGPFSTNAAFINNDYRVNAYNSNTATVNNSVNATADTGSNRADNNTGPATIRTGGTALGVGVATHVNDNLTDIGFFGGGASGNNTAGNGTTGPFSTNTATVNNVADAQINNVNDLQINNLVDIAARTGRNSASNNTLGGDIETGGASAGVGVNSEGNINTTTVAVAMGSFSNDASSDVTGPDSTNVAYINNQRNVRYDNWNNKCQSHNADDRFGNGTAGSCDVNDLGVFNTITSDVDAGSNDSDNNTGGGSVMAGWASLIQELLTHLNDNLNVISL